MTHKEIKELMEKAKSAPPGPYTEFGAAANPQVVLDLCERVIGLSEALEKVGSYFDILGHEDCDGIRFLEERVSVAHKALERFGVKQ